VWIHAHFPHICGRVEDARYDESQPAANKYIPKKGMTLISTYRSALDRTLAFDITWESYGQHRATRPLQDVCFYFGCLRSGHFIALHLPEWVFRQFGFTQIIPRLPSQAADPFAK
ncbi:serine/threonine-protein phosphatase 7 long form-like protein, partial [Trifolium medium]|nr:serine/threonine-protein phosphatase 7 long form-like protein [Trifolium medium]